MKIGLVSTGLGRVLRGFESFTESLFQALGRYAPEIHVTLFQGGGKPSGHRVVVPNFHRYDLPSRWLGQERGLLLENRSFALAIYPFLRKDSFDIVHYNELVMGSALFHLRRLFGGRFKLLYCNGAPSPPVHYYHRCDFAQLLHGPMLDEALAFGIPETRLFLLPYGTDADRFSLETRNFRSQARRELMIPEDAIVVLTVAALSHSHKRIDYVIHEISSLPQSVWLLAAGQRTDETALLEQEAVRSMPGRFRFVSWPHDRMHLLYGAADVFVLASLSEGFGLVTVEAMLSGLPVIIHNGQVFRWLTEGSAVHCIDMAADGELSRAITAVQSRNTSSRDQAAERFSWECLVPQYLQMYRDVMGRN